VDTVVVQRLTHLWHCPRNVAVCPLQQLCVSYPHLQAVCINVNKQISFGGHGCGPASYHLWHCPRNVAVCPLPQLCVSYPHLQAVCIKVTIPYSFHRSFYLCCLVPCRNNCTLPLRFVCQVPLFSWRVRCISGVAI
jgi:hypothetical protein